MNIFIFAHLGSCAVDYVANRHCTRSRTFVKRLPRKEKVKMPRTHSSFFKMLSARNRVQILKPLRQHNNLAVDDLATWLGVTVPTVSRHLRLPRMQDP